MNEKTILLAEYYQMKYPELKGFRETTIIQFGRNKEIRKLYEGLIKTIDIYQAAGILKIAAKISSDDIEVFSGKNIINLNLQNFNFTRYQELLLKINNLGWFISSIGTRDENGDENTIKFVNQSISEFKKLIDRFQEVYLILEAKFDSDISNVLKDFSNSGRFILHVSPMIYRKKILESGLVPKTKSKLSFHPERIYFILPESNDNYLKMCSSLSKELFNAMPIASQTVILNFTNPPRYDIWKLDLEKAQNIIFLKDPNSPGCYTLQNINPTALSILNTIIV